MVCNVVDQEIRRYRVVSGGWGSVAPSPGQLPSAISDLAVITSSTSARLTWTPNGGTVSVYRRNVSANGSFTLLTSGLSGAATFFDDAGLTAGTDYQWRITSTNEYGTSPYSNTVSATTGVVVIEDAYVPEFYLPESLTWISWDAPTIAHVGVDIDYKFTGYDWFNRPLFWSLVTPLDGATMDADGTLHWSPPSEGPQNITVRMTVNGQNYDKTFTCDVDNARVIHVATTGNDTTGDGSEDLPFATLGRAGSGVTAGTGVLIYLRGGVYTLTDTNWYSEPLGTGYRILAASNFTETDPLIIRSYPGEYVKLIFAGASSGMNVSERVICYGMELEGGTIGERACIGTQADCALKYIVAHDYQSSYTENCTGIKAMGGTIIDRCISFDNYDRANPDRHNNSNYNFFGTSGSRPVFVIDSISAGRSAVGMKIKHAGSQSNVHVHRCVLYGTLNGWGGADNGSSIRHSLIYKDSTLGDSTNGSYVFGFGMTDPETGGQNNLNIGMLCDSNIILSDSDTSTGLFQANYVGNVASETPVWYNNNLVQLSRSADGAVFETHLYASLPSDWNAVFNSNEFISPSSVAPVRMGSGAGGLFAIDRLNNYGESNAHSTARKDVTLSACGSEWFYDESEHTLYRDGVAVSGALA